MLAEVLSLHWNEARDGKTLEVYKAAREARPDGPCAGVLYEDMLRRRRCVDALMRAWAAMAPCAERDALGVLPSALYMRRAGNVVELGDGERWQAFACERPTYVEGFFFYLNPGGLARTERELLLMYAELDSVIQNS